MNPTLLFVACMIGISLFLLILSGVYVLMSIGRRNYEIADSINVDTQINMNRFNMWLSSLQAEHNAKLASQRKRKERESNIFPINKKDDDKDK